MLHPGDSLSGRLLRTFLRCPFVQFACVPGWAVVVGIIGLLVFFLGLLFFLVKKIDSLTVSISARGEDGCTVMVSGEAEDSVIRNVQAALAGTAPTASSKLAQSKSQAVQDAKLGKLKQ